MVIFHSYVSLPEGTQLDEKNDHGKFLRPWIDRDELFQRHIGISLAMGYAPALLPIYSNEENDDPLLFFWGYPNMFRQSHFFRADIPPRVLRATLPGGRLPVFSGHSAVRTAVKERKCRSEYKPCK